MPGLPPPPLACTVRDCGLLLERDGGTLRCQRRHTYDVARAGYVNLLQPTDRRSLTAGDAPDAIAARARLLAQGVGRASLSAVAEAVLAGAEVDVVVDLGSGSGALLADIHARRPITGIGIDLSTAGVEFAARHHPQLTWVVANADRRLPLLDHTVDVVVSLHGRRHPAECARVLVGGGRLVVAVPAADDLAELRTRVQGAAVARDRMAALIAEHDGHFAVHHQQTVRQTHRLDAGQLQDLLRGTYRGARTREAARAVGLDALDVTVASDIVVFTPRAR